MRRAIWCTALGLLTALGGCAYPLYALALTSSDSDDDPAPAPAPGAPGNALPSANASTPAGNQWQDVTVNYVLIDAEGDAADAVVSYSYSSDGGSSWSPFAAATERTGPPSDGLLALTATASGSAHVFVWDSATDIGAGISGLARIRVTPNVAGAPASVGTAGETAVAGFAIDNLRPTAVPATPVGNQTASVRIDYTLSDAESDAADVAITYEFSTDGGSSWTPPATATETAGAPSEGTTALGTTPTGAARVFVWNSFADIGGIDGLARLTIAPSDPGPPVRAGTSGTTAVTGFPVLNRRIATVAGPAAGLISFPGAVARDSNDNLYIADTLNHRVQVLNTQVGSITVAGVVIAANQLGVVSGTGVGGFNGDNQLATTAQLNFPSDLVVDGSGNIFVADSLNHRVRRIDGLTGFITTVVGNGGAGSGGDGGLATLAQLKEPRGIALDGNGNLYIADTLNHRIRVVNNQGSAITVAGVTVQPSQIEKIVDGGAGNTGDTAAATAAKLSEPWDVTLDGAGNCYVADSVNHAIRVINTTVSNHTVAGVSINGGDIDTVAGTNGTPGVTGDGAAATSATLSTPKRVVLDSSGNLYIADTGNGRVRVVSAQVASLVLAGVTIATNDIDTIAGGGGSPGPNNGDGAAATSAGCSPFEGLVVTSTGHVAIADTGLGRLRLVNTGTGSISVAGVSIGGGNIDTLAGVTLSSLTLLRPSGVAQTGSLLFVADRDAHRVYQIDLTTGIATVIVGGAAKGNTGDGGPATAALLEEPRGLALDASGNLYISDWNNNSIRVVNRGTVSATFHGVLIGAGNIDTVLAAGSANDSPGIAVNQSTGDLYLAHRGGDRIMKLDTAGTLTTEAGGTGTGFTDGARTATAVFDEPADVWIDGAGNLVVADGKNEAVRYVNLASSPSVTVCGVTINIGDVGTIAGTGTAGFNGDNQIGTLTLFDGVRSVARLASGDIVVTDELNQRVRKIDQTTGVVTTIAGTGVAGFNQDGIPPTNAHLNAPTFLTLDTSTPANLYFSDVGNRRVRRFTP